VHQPGVNLTIKPGIRKVVDGWNHSASKDIIRNNRLYLDIERQDEHKAKIKLEPNDIPKLIEEFDAVLETIGYLGTVDMISVTGGGLQYSLVPDSQKCSNWDLVYGGLKVAFAGAVEAKILDSSCLSVSQSQRLIGTQNTKYENTVSYIHEQRTPTDKLDIERLMYLGTDDAIKQEMQETRPVGEQPTILQTAAQALQKYTKYLSFRLYIDGLELATESFYDMIGKSVKFIKDIFPEEQIAKTFGMLEFVPGTPQYKEAVARTGSRYTAWHDPTRDPGDFDSRASLLKYHDNKENLYFDMTTNPETKTKKRRGYHILNLAAKKIFGSPDKLPEITKLFLEKTGIAKIKTVWIGSGKVGRETAALCQAAVESMNEWRSIVIEEENRIPSDEEIIDIIKDPAKYLSKFTEELIPDMEDRLESAVEDQDIAEFMDVLRTVKVSPKTKERAFRTMLNRASLLDGLEELLKERPPTWEESPPERELATVAA